MLPLAHCTTKYRLLWPTEQGVFRRGTRAGQTPWGEPGVKDHYWDITVFSCSLRATVRCTQLNDFWWSCTQTEKKHTKFPECDEHKQLKLNSRPWMDYQMSHITLMKLKSHWYRTCALQRRPIDSATETLLKITVDQEEQSVDFMLRGNKQGADYLHLVHHGKLMPNQLFKAHLWQTCCNGFTNWGDSWSSSKAQVFWH